MPVLSTSSPEKNDSSAYVAEIAGKTALDGTVEATEQEKFDRLMNGADGNSAEPNTDWPQIDPDADHGQLKIDAQPVQEAAKNNDNEA